MKGIERVPHHGQVSSCHHDAVSHRQDVVKVDETSLTLNLADHLDLRGTSLGQHLGTLQMRRGGRRQHTRVSEGEGRQGPPITALFGGRRVSKGQTLWCGESGCWTRQGV